MTSTLYRRGVVHSSADPFAEAILIDDGVVAWLGADDTADGMADGADEVIDLDGAIVTPGFVDAHMHILRTGLTLDGVDLSGAHSLVEALDLLADAAANRPRSTRTPLLGFGWEDHHWPEHRPPSRWELDQACGGASVLLTRADGHSAVASSAFALAVGLARRVGWHEDGFLTGEAHSAAMAATIVLDEPSRTALYRRALDDAAAHGVVSVHDLSGPHLDTPAGLRSLLEMTADPASLLPKVVGYWAQLCVTVDDVRAIVEQIPGLTGIGGDLAVDGSIGSRTALLRRPYADAPETNGERLLTAEQIANHIGSATRAGLQAGLHVIGDAALDEVLLGIRTAAEVEGIPAVAGAAHRLEHLEMVDAAALAQLVLFGLSASIQPVFDAMWGAPDGLYETRLGRLRASALNPIADLAEAGVPLALGSDSPVTSVDPWAWVQSAFAHHQPDQRISARAAFRAATRGGWRLAGLHHTGAGELRVGAPAHLAVWRAEELAVQAVDGRFTSWSTDARAGTPVLPALGPDHLPPVCLRTVRDGRTLYDAFG